MFAAALHGAARGRGLARRLALVALGTVIGYTLLVYERADIHIAEMVPFFIGSFLAWAGSAVSSWPRGRSITTAATTGRLVAGLGLCAHHGLKYRPQAYTPRPAATALGIRGFLTPGEGKASPDPSVVIGNDSLWFWLHGAIAVEPARMARLGPAPGGTVIAVCHPAELPWLGRCALEFSDPGHGFAVFRCPRAVAGASVDRQPPAAALPGPGASSRGGVFVRQAPAIPANH